MTENSETAAAGAAPAGDAAHAAARADLWSGGAWMTLATAILTASIRMDRLEDQDINPYTIPGLLPGLLACVMLFFGAMLALRAIRRGALAGARSAAGSRPARADSAPGRTLLVIGLCVAFDVLLVGHGLPFWAAAAIFVTVAILALERNPDTRIGHLPTPAAALKAAVIGVIAGVVVTTVFQEVFLVHLP